MYDKPKYGSDVIVDLMQAFGIEYASLNPGSSFRGLHDSLVNYGKNRPQIIECCHEEVAVAMAHGYAKACGKPMVAIVHNVVGLLHGTMAIYYAYLDRVPVLVVGATGPMDTKRRRPFIDWIHTAVVQGNQVRDYVKWDDQPFSFDSIPDSFARGYRVAMTEPKGPVYLCYDVGLQLDELPHPIPLPNPSKFQTPPALLGDIKVLEEVARMLADSQQPVILTDYLGKNPAAVGSLVELVDLLGIPVIDLNHRFNFPNTHPLDLSESNILKEADLVLSLDVRDLYGPLTHPDKVSRTTIIPKGCKIVEIGLGDLGINSWSQEFQKLQEVDLSILADTAVALPYLVECCRRQMKDKSGLQARARQRAETMATIHSNLRTGWQEESRRNWNAKPMTTARLAQEIWSSIGKEDWVLTANTLNGWARRVWDWSKPYQHPGKSLGTATQIGISLGVALAYKGSGKLVVDIQPDGDLLFDASALWVATHDQIPMLVIMYNNRAYYNDWEHQIRLAEHRGTDPNLAYLGMEIEKPAPDFAKLAQSFGWYAEGPIEDGDRVRPAIERAIRVIKEEGRPALVDTVTQFR